MKRLTASLSPIIVVLAAFGAACGDSKPKEPPAATAASPEPADDAPEAAGITVTSFGVPECDTYVTQYLACVEGKVPADQKKGLVEAFEANRTKWRAMSTMQEGAMALSAACKAAAQKAKEELSVDYGCEF